MDKWLDRFDRILTIIRPKAYNIIARSVIGLGIILVAESQLNITQAIVIALYEYFLGHSEVLREFINNNSSPWLGMVLISSGLIYHYLMTVGKEQIELQIAKLPNAPKLTLFLLNADNEKYKNETICLRGHIVNVPAVKDIPEYRVNHNLPNMDRFGTLFNTIGNMERNPEYYKERAKLLNVWGGAELLRLKIKNNSKTLATGVRVEIKIIKTKGVSVDNTNTVFPKLPSEKSEDSFSRLSFISPINAVTYDIKKDHTGNEYCFYWNLNDIQANTFSISETCIFLRSEIDTKLEITIYCDQFQNPTNQEYVINRIHVSPVEVSASDLMSDNKIFNDLLNHCVMDGYIQRYSEKILAQYEHKSQELIP